MRSAVFVLLVLALFQTVIAAPTLSRRAEKYTAKDINVRNLQQKCVDSGFSYQYIRHLAVYNGFPAGICSSNDWYDQSFQYTSSYIAVDYSYYSLNYGMYGIGGNYNCNIQCNNVIGLFADIKLAQDQFLKENQKLKSADKAV